MHQWQKDASVGEFATDEKCLSVGGISGKILHQWQFHLSVGTGTETD